jgi:hypothetical protein
MKTINKLYLITIIGLLSTNVSFAQKLMDEKQKIDTRIVEKLNTPTKMWVNGNWEINLDGTKTWKKGHWRFEEKSFQQKSKIYRNKMLKRQKA